MASSEEESDHGSSAIQVSRKMFTFPQLDVKSVRGQWYYFELDQNWLRYLPLSAVHEISPSSCSCASCSCVPRRWFVDKPQIMRIRRLEGEIKLKHITVDVSVMQQTRVCTLRLGRTGRTMRLPLGRTLHLSVQPQDVQPQDELFIRALSGRIRELSNRARQARDQRKAQTDSAESAWSIIGVQVLQGRVRLMVPGPLHMRWRTFTVRVQPHLKFQGELSWIPGAAPCPDR